MSEPTTKAGRALHDWLGWHPIDGRDDRIFAIEVEAYERGCVAGMAIEKYAPQPDTASRELDVARLAEAIDKHRREWPQIEYHRCTALCSAEIAREYATLAATEGE